MITLSSYSINYIKDDGTEFDLPLEEWQMKAIVQFLGLILFEDEDGSARFTYLAKKIVHKRLSDLGIKVIE